MYYKTEAELQAQVDFLLPLGERPISVKLVNRLPYNWIGSADYSHRIIRLLPSEYSCMELTLIHELAHLLCGPGVGHTKAHKRKEEALARRWGFRLERASRTKYFKRVHDLKGRLVWESRYAKEWDAYENNLAERRRLRKIQKLKRELAKLRAEV